MLLNLDRHTTTSTIYMILFTNVAGDTILKFVVEIDLNAEIQIDTHILNIYNTGFFHTQICFIKSPKQRLETYCFCSVSYYYYYYYSPPFFLSLAHALVHGRSQELWTEFHETWWSYRYMFLVGPSIFSFVLKGDKIIF